MVFEEKVEVEKKSVPGEPSHLYVDVSLKERVVSLEFKELSDRVIEVLWKDGSHLWKLTLYPKGTVLSFDETPALLGDADNASSQELQKVKPSVANPKLSEDALNLILSHYHEDLLYSTLLLLDQATFDIEKGNLGLLQKIILQKDSLKPLNIISDYISLKLFFLFQKDPILLGKVAADVAERLGAWRSYLIQKMPRAVLNDYATREHDMLISYWGQQAQLHGEKYPWKESFQSYHDHLQVGVGYDTTAPLLWDNVIKPLSETPLPNSELFDRDTLLSKGVVDEMVIPFYMELYRAFRYNAKPEHLEYLATQAATLMLSDIDQIYYVFAKHFWKRGMPHLAEKYFQEVNRINFSMLSLYQKLLFQRRYFKQEHNLKTIERTLIAIQYFSEGNSKVAWEWIHPIFTSPKTAKLKKSLLFYYWGIKVAVEIGYLEVAEQIFKEVSQYYSWEQAYLSGLKGIILTKTNPVVAAEYFEYAVEFDPRLIFPHQYLQKLKSGEPQ